ncbi:hypothetical protein [Streptomyces sp. NPDC059008]|uniref:hypothetical protein n=1 Tax=Streptomyces sp. NPDC059008 TaxID=3346693 RepID=UPI0036CA74F1
MAMTWDGAGGARTAGGGGSLRDVWSGRALVVSMAALFAEAACATAGLVLYGFTLEAPVGNLFLAAFLAPVALVLGALPGLVLTATLVLPTLTLARWAARRTGRQGRTGWWWTVAAAPVSAAAATLAHGVLLALLTRSVGPPAFYLACWAALATAAVPAALVADIATRGTGARRTVRLTVVVAGGGLLTAFALGCLGVAGMATGLLPAYEPPRLGRAELVGVWKDDGGGTLVLRSDGVASAQRMSRPKDRCAGVGTWELERFMGKEELRVDVAGDCRGQWYIGGTEERPTLYYFLGDPDAWHRHVLTRK